MFLVKKMKIARKKKSVDVMATGGYMMISPSNQPPPETETIAETLTSQLGKMTSYVHRYRYFSKNHGVSVLLVFSFVSVEYIMSSFFIFTF